MSDKHLKELSNVGTVNEVAPLVGVTPQTIKNWCMRGYIAYRKSGKIYLVHIDSLKEFERNGFNATANE